ncbi:MAG: hypothetical protein C0504_00640 [Candidatus Solibacter sp.]|nr:hypothetical protein [Candidatus Solibacter sp.]
MARPVFVVAVTPVERAVLLRRASSPASTQRDALRARMVLLRAEGNRFLADLTSECIRGGSFQRARELVAAIEEYLAARDRNPKRYVRRAAEEGILRRIACAKEALNAVTIS